MTISKVRQIAFLGLMLAVIIVLSAIEQMLPPLPLLPPNVKLGLSNIVTMYCVFFIGKSQAVLLGTLKSFFVFLMRGFTAGLLSFAGGMLSIAVIILLVLLFKERISYVAISIVGAIMHNMGQIGAYSLILKTNILFYYAPVLLVSGIIMGVVTGTMLKILLPYMKKVLR